MVSTRRLAALEARQTVAALGRLRTAWDRYCACPPLAAEKRARLQAEHDAWPASERATAERHAVAVDTLLDPATPPAGIAHAAAALGDAGTPTWEVLAALAEQFATLASAAETRG